MEKNKPKPKPKPKAVVILEELVIRLQDRIDKCSLQKDSCYRERNQLVRFLTFIYPAFSFLALHDESDQVWDWDYRNIVVIELNRFEGDGMEGVGGKVQLSWHIHDSELPLFSHLKFKKDYVWDGHTNDDKYDRLSRLGKHGGVIIY